MKRGSETSYVVSESLFLYFNAGRKTVPSLKEHIEQGNLTSITMVGEGG